MIAESVDCLAPRVREFDTKKSARIRSLRKEHLVRVCGCWKKSYEKRKNPTRVHEYEKKLNGSWWQDESMKWLPKPTITKRENKDDRDAVRKKNDGHENEEDDYDEEHDWSK